MIPVGLTKSQGPYKRKAGESESEMWWHKQRLELTALKMEKRAKSLEMQAASKSWKNKGNRFSNKAYQSNAALPKPDFNLRPIVDFWSAELLDNISVLFEATKFVVICYRSNRKWMHSIVYLLSSHLPESLGKAMLINKSVLQPDSANPIHAPGGPSIPLLFWPCDSYLLWTSVVIILKLP